MLAAPDVLWTGLNLTRALKAAGVPMLTGERPVEIQGSPDGGVEALAIADASGRPRIIACDAVGLGWHLRSETQLADLARCEFEFDQGSRTWRPRKDACGRSTQPGVYLAGDGAEVLGARAAEASGRLAALAALSDLGRPVEGVRIAAEQRELARWRRFAAGLRQAFPWPADQVAGTPDDAVICRCEAVTAGELRRVVREAGAGEANRAKAFSRVGMGRCQGRYCGLTGAEVIAAAAGEALIQAGRLRGQAPVKPFPIGVSEDAP
jgi:hypothetical protein